MGKTEKCTTINRKVNMIIKHKFNKLPINPNTEILIIGTFNPDVSRNKEADFYYTRSRNYLWSLLPKVFNNASLKEESKEKKFEFIKKYNISFIDLINEVIIEETSINEIEKNIYADIYLDDKVKRWINIIEILKSNKKIIKVFFTRKTFSKIPNIKEKIQEIKTFCKNNNIKFEYLISPARFENDKKLNTWKAAFGK